MNKVLFEREISEKAKLVDKALNMLLPLQSDVPEQIHQAMRYSVFAGGKRLRPILVLASAEAVGGNADAVLPAACAMEMIHTYSLIHDDLPAMDNDDYRRGKLTNHKVFGEAMAVLAGDALLTLAFEVITDINSFTVSKVPPELLIKVIQEVAVAAGSKGMIGGQAVDILSENRKVDKSVLKYIHIHKTGALFRASVRCGAILGGGTEQQICKLTEYAENLGLAFQITDDILDVEGESQKLGKAVGSDERQKKCTYPSIFGLEESKRFARETIERAVLCLNHFGHTADILRFIATRLINRDN